MFPKKEFDIDNYEDAFAALKNATNSNAPFFSVMYDAGSYVLQFFYEDDFQIVFNDCEGEETKTYAAFFDTVDIELSSKILKDFCNRNYNYDYITWSDIS